MQTKSPLSKGIRFFREGVKKTGALLAAKTCGANSYSLFGIPSGLETHETGSKKLLYPHLPLTMNPPATIEKKLYWRFQAILSGMEIPEVGILELKEGIATAKGGNLSAKGKLVMTFLQPIDGKAPEQNDLFKFSTKRFFPKIFRSEQPVITLAAGWQGAFYHWVFEVLPRLHLVEKAGYSTEKVFVEAHFAFQKQSLELLGIGQEQIINASEYEAVKAPKLIVPAISETPTVWACQYLRKTFLPKVSKLPRFRLYVSRNDASRRRVINEEPLLKLLKKFDFQKVELSHLSFKEQIELFQAADAVVGPHGAGFSHLAFCDPGTPVLEFFSPAYVNCCYWHVCDRLGLPYHYLFGEGERYPDFVNTHLDPDIELAIDKVEASLKLMGL